MSGLLSLKDDPAANLQVVTLLLVLQSFLAIPSSPSGARRGPFFLWFPLPFGAGEPPLQYEQDLVKRKIVRLLSWYGVGLFLLSQLIHDVFGASFRRLPLRLDIRSWRILTEQSVARFALLIESPNNAIGAAML